ncbi:roadblock/LC7 domain-containing protein [Streptomyces sp. NPDC020875]|uniref:roadblock/LC7 domain-containing protein n=1 Tax=Streptomyces sp. NPDC020875 TaxID=3154898 RepID=UPI003400C0F5
MKNPVVQELLDEKVSEIAGVRSVVVVSEDGLTTYWSGTTQDSADKRAAIASGLSSLAASLAAEDDGGHVRRAMIEMDHSLFIIVRATSDSFLAASAQATADLGTVGYELTLLAQRLAPVLEAGPRRAGAEGGAPA